MRMFVPGINLYLFEKLSSQAVFGQHPLNSKTDKVLRPFFQQFLCSNSLESSYVTAVSVIAFLIPFTAGQDNFIGVYNYNRVASINMRREKRVVFSSKA